jgi:Carbohydrate binding domain/Glycosyl hydrolases family 18
MMRRSGRLALAAGAVVAVVAAVSVAATAAQADTNTISNPGFESGLTGWSCTATSTAGGGHAHSGAASLIGTPAGQDNAQCTQTVTVAPSTKYTLSAWVNGSYVYIGATGTGTTDVSTWTPGTGGYQQLSVSFTTGASTRSVTVFVHGWYGQPTYYADDFSMPGPGGGTPTPTATPTKTTSPSPSPTTSVPPPPPNGNFRAPIYFMPLDNQPQNITDAMNASGARNFNLAFVLDSGGCTPAWDGDSNHKVSSDSTVTGVVNAVRAAGGDVSVSFGGYNGVELGATCGGASGLANAYQQVINKYRLTRIDLDYEGDDLDANMGVRFGAIKILEQNNPNLKVSLTIPATTVGFPDTGKDEIRQAISAGARLDLVNFMAFDYGGPAGSMAASVQSITDQAAAQLSTLYGWSSATAYAHLGLQLMNGHTDQPSELFTQDTFRTLLSYARSKHVGWFSYWSLNRDRACDPSVPHNWAEGYCSSVSQTPYEFSKIVAQYTG